MRPEIERLMAQGNLNERLQGWIVLCMYCDSMRIARPEFPLPTGGAGLPTLEMASDRLLHVPPKRLGHTHFIGRFSAIESLVRNLKACHFDLSGLESRMAELLPPEEENWERLRKAEPHRRGDFYCTPFEAESVVGQVALAALVSAPCDQTLIPFLAQGFLSNEDGWLERSPPRRASHSTQWPPRNKYGSDEGVPEERICEQLRGLAQRLDVPGGWRMFAGYVVSYTSKKEFILRIWWEQTPDELVLAPARHSTILSGRSFLWWLGGFAKFPQVRIASGRFVAGHQRLHRSHFEIQPPGEWPDVLGWTPDRQNPLVWLSNGVEVARYDRLHGPLGEIGRGPHHREQPLISRWLITDLAFQQFEEAFGELRLREEFDSYRFEET